MSEAVVKHLLDRVAELEAAVVWEKRKADAKAKSLENVDNIFLLFEAAKVSPQDLSERRICCGWTERGETCGVPATEVLPRPAIFVCEAHLEAYNRKVEEANKINGDTVHVKRVRTV